MGCIKVPFTRNLVRHKIMVKLSLQGFQHAFDLFLLQVSSSYDNGRCIVQNMSSIWARGYKTFFKLNSAEHEILNAHKYENIKNFSFFFQAQISLESYYSCL